MTLPRCIAQHSYKAYTHTHSSLTHIDTHTFPLLTQHHDTDRWINMQERMEMCNWKPDLKGFKPLNVLIARVYAGTIPCRAVVDLKKGGGCCSQVKGNCLPQTRSLSLSLYLKDTHTLVLTSNLGSL